MERVIYRTEFARVLGERKYKSLRGGKMEDIIFAGSDARKAVNFGEVSLTLDNEDHALALDFGEVTVAFVVYIVAEIVNILLTNNLVV